MPRISSSSPTTPRAVTTSRRLLKAAEAIREVVSLAILTELKDPRVRDVTVTRVEVSPDMRLAKVHVSVRGDEARQQLSLRGLQNAAGFLQSKLNRRIDTRYTPRLHFVLDPGVKNSLEVIRILNEVLPKEPPREASPAPGAEAEVSETDQPDEPAFRRSGAEDASPAAETPPGFSSPSLENET